MKNDFTLELDFGKAPLDAGVYVRTPEDAWGVCRETDSYGTEAFTVMCLNSRNRLIAGGIISSGIVDSTLVHPREVFRKAIAAGASGVILSHNHPSGDPAPSAEDIRITRQLIQAGQIIGINVLDHVIIGRKTEDRLKPWLSMREAGLVEFAT